MLKLTFFIFISFSFFCFSSEKEVKVSVEKYFLAFQNQNWEDLLNLTHTSLSENIKKSYLSDIPNNNEQALEIPKESLNKKLSILKVKDAESAWKMDSKKLYLLVLQDASKHPSMKQLKKVKTIIDSIDIIELDVGVYRAKVMATSIVNLKEISATKNIFLRKEGS